MTALFFPKRKTIVRVLSIPASDPREIDEMVKLQAAHQTPLDLDEIAIDYQVLETTADGYSRVLLVIVLKTDLDEEIAKYEKGEVSAERVIIQEGNGHEFNLLAEKERQIRERMLLQEKLKKFAAKILAGVASLAVLISLGFYAKYRQLEKLSRASAALGSDTQEVRRMAARIAAVKAQMSQPGSFLNVMAELNRLVPERLSLRSVDYEHAHSLLIQGSCFSLSEAVRLVEILQKSPLFSHVELRSSMIQRLRDREVVDFSVECEFHAKA